jgi:hypothetical protein
MSETKPGGLLVIASLCLFSLTVSLLIAAGAQDIPPIPLPFPGITPIHQGIFSGQWSFSTASTRTATDPALAGVILAGETPLPSGGIQRITLQQVQQSANRAAIPLQRLGMLSVEAARQHRLAVRADYFPKFGATAFNLHYTDFLGQIVAVRRPILGVTQQVPIAIINQHQTFAALTFVQPITPISRCIKR